MRLLKALDRLRGARAGAVSHSARLVAGLRAVESEEGAAALFHDPLAGLLAGDSVVQDARDYANVRPQLRRSRLSTVLCWHVSIVPRKA